MELRLKHQNEATQAKAIYKELQKFKETRKRGHITKTRLWIDQQICSNLFYITPYLHTLYFLPWIGSLILETKPNARLRVFMKTRSHMKTRPYARSRLNMKLRLKHEIEAQHENEVKT